MIDLPDVTVVAVDGVARELTYLALHRTLAQIKPAEVIFPEIELKTADEADACLWGICATVKTSHALVIQYDGYVLDDAMWKTEYLNYDYIGAPWPHEGLQIGNGGFSLRSKRMMRFLVEQDEFPLATPEDAMICLNYKKDLEKEGFRWPPNHIAHQFSFERCPKRRSFGFHGIYNLHKVMSLEKLTEWAKHANDYVRGKSEWVELSNIVVERYGITL
jgi:hypothetical protein